MDSRLRGDDEKEFYSSFQKYSDVKTSRRQYTQYGKAKATKYEDFWKPLYTVKGQVQHLALKKQAARRRPVVRD
jgi:hypothetical protein